MMKGLILMNGTGAKHITDKLAFYFSAGISGMIVIPALYIMTFTFVICAIFIVGYTVAGLFFDLPGAVNIGFMTLTGVPAFIVAFIIGIMLFLLGVLCRRLLKRYLAYVSSRYQKLHTEK